MHKKNQTQNSCIGWKCEFEFGFLQLTSKRNPLIRRFLAASVDVLKSAMDDGNECDDDDAISEKSAKDDADARTRMMRGWARRRTRFLIE